MTDSDVHRLTVELRQVLPAPPGRLATAPVDRLLAAGRRSRRRRAAAGAVVAVLAAGAAGAGMWQLYVARRDISAAQADRPTTPWRGALLRPDGRSVLLGYGLGCPPGPDRVVVREDPATVRIGIVHQPRSAGDCAGSYVPATIEAALARPLGDRRLVDALTGQEHQPVAGSQVLRPTYLPFAIPLTPATEEPTAETGPSGWQRYYESSDRQLPTVLIQQSPAAAARPWSQARRFATASVHGHPAVVWVRSSGAGSEYILEWTAGGWIRAVSVDPVPAGRSGSLTAELVRVAESLR